MIEKAARRYAKAFMGVSLESEKLEEVYTDFRSVEDLLSSNMELSRFLKSPVIRSEAKRKAIQEVFSNLNPLSLRFLDFVIEKGRANLLESVVLAFVEAYKVHVGLRDVHIESAVDMDDENVQRLTSILEKKLDGTVVIHSATDSTLLGGLSVQVGDTIIDGTVRHKLNRLATSFKEAAIKQ